MTTETRHPDPVEPGTLGTLGTLASGVSGTRKPYTAPRLRHLGSVRELTLGATMGIADGAGGKKAFM